MASNRRVWYVYSSCVALGDACSCGCGVASSEGRHSFIGVWNTRKRRRGGGGGRGAREHSRPKVVAIDALSDDHKFAFLWGDAAAKAERNNETGFSKVVFKMCFTRVENAGRWLSIALDPSANLQRVAEEVSRQKNTTFGGGVLVSDDISALAEQPAKRRRSGADRRPPGAPAATLPGMQQG